MNITIYTYRWNSKQKHYDIIPLKGGEPVDSAKTKFKAELKLKFLHEQQERSVTNAKLIEWLQSEPVAERVERQVPDRKPIETETLKRIYEKGEKLERFERSAFYREQCEILDVSRGTLRRKINKQVLGIAA